MTMIARVDHCASAFRCDGIPKLGVRYLRLQPATNGAGSLRPVNLGDLNKEWTESLAIAKQKPDLKTLDAELKAWWDARH